jgi:hypothetical protein
MNGYAMITADQALRLANERIAELRREARDERLAADLPRHSLAAAVRSAFSSFRAAVARVDHAALATPRLADYPYRS